MPNLPLPKGIEKMPKGFVFLGEGGSFIIPKNAPINGFEGIRKDKKQAGMLAKWSEKQDLAGTNENLLYAAHRNSPIAKANRCAKPTTHTGAAETAEAPRISWPGEHV